MEISELVNLLKVPLPDGDFYFRDLTGEGNHFEAFIISDLFQGKSRIQQQQLVMGPLRHLFDGPLHALTIKTFTFEEWKKNQENL